MAESVRIQKGKARIPGRPNRYFFKKGKQGFMNNRIGPDFKGECRGPWTAESARILKRGFKNPGTAESVQIFKGLGAGIHGHPILIQFEIQKGSTDGRTGTNF